MARLVPSNIIKPSSNFLTDLSKAVPLLWILFEHRVCLCLTVLSVPCSLVVTCWERADLLAFVRVMFACVFVTFSYGFLRQMWYLIVLIPDLCLLPYFYIYGFDYDCTMVGQASDSMTILT